MSLLDDVSIVVTPNGYNAGTLYAVVPVPTEGSELVVNSDFSSNTWWGLDSSWTISGGSANSNGTGTMYKGGILTIGKRYIVKVDVSAYTSGSLSYPNASYNIPSLIGTYTFDYVAASQTISFTGTSFVGSIDNVSVKEYTSADMDVTRATAATRVDENGLVNYAEVIGGEEITNGGFATDTDWNEGTGITIGSGVALFTSVSSGQQLSQSSTPAVSGKIYKISYEIKTRTEGAFSASIGGALSSNQNSAVGVYTEYLTATGTGIFYIRSRGTTSGSIDNVSVKEAARDNVPRIDYTGGGCPHILAEPMRTNLITYSEDFSNAAWLSTNQTITLSSVLSPNGTSFPYKLTATGNFSKIYESISLSATTTYVVSFYTKNISAVNPLINVYDQNNAVSLLTQYYGSELSTSEWVRITGTFTTTTAATVQLQICRDLNNTEEMLIWGASLEVGSYPTSYIPTNGSTVTRNQDIFTRDGIGSLINSTEGVLFVEMAALSDDGTDRRLSLSNGTVGNAINIGLSRFSGNINAEIHSGGVLQTSGWGATGVTQTNNNKFALSWGSGAIKFYVNGSPTNTDTGITSPIGLNSLKLSSGDDTLNLFAKVKQLQVFKTSLSDTQLAALTSL